MHQQLQEVMDEFGAASERLRRLAEAVPPERWTERPAANSWSVAECVAHLNLTSRAFVPLLREALARGRANGGQAPRRYRRDLLGWLVWRAAREDGRLKAKTAPSFVPGASVPPAQLVSEFERLQEEQLELVRQADGLPLDRIKVASPFDGRVKYSVFSALTILPAHQHRHLLQAERAWQAVSASTTPAGA